MIKRRIEQAIMKQQSRSKSKDATAQLKQRKSSNPVKPAKVLSYEELKQWNEKFKLSGKIVYQLDAEFTSLVKI
jgi:hypothetical protein